jgi:D-glycero-D-manno-heptose 1,7-bisphosphate phosphatase
MQPAIFLDRDGVIIENRPDYVQNWSQVKFIPGALKALAFLNQLPMRIVLVTNQAGIGRKIISPENAAAINQHIKRAIVDAGGRIDGTYICPHTPEDHCSCRKPKPGLILQAVHDLDIDLSKSTLIGDNLTDIQAGMAAKVKRIVLVRTGLGGIIELELPQLGLSNIPVYDNLFQAVENLFNTDYIHTDQQVYQDDQA